LHQPAESVSPRVLAQWGPGLVLRAPRSAGLLVADLPRASPAAVARGARATAAPSSEVGASSSDLVGSPVAAAEPVAMRLEPNETLLVAPGARPSLSMAVEPPCAGPACAQAGDAGTQ
jgi:hypothetical protein